MLVGLVEFLDDGGGQFGDVQLSLPQRGHPDGKDAQTVVEVLPEGAFGDALLQVSVGGGDDPDVNGNGLAAPHPGDLFFLENPKELGLGGQGELTYFVQENGALVGHLEEAGFALSVGTGEGTPLIAEELTFRQAFRDGAAVDPDEVFSGPRGVLVDVGGNPFLAGARLPLDEDHRVQLGGPAHDAQEVQGGRVLRHQLGGVEELVPDDRDLLLIAGGEAALVVQGLLEGDELRDVPDVGDHQANLVCLVVNGGAGDHRPLAGGEGLVDGDRLALRQGLQGGGVGDGAPADQFPHGDPQDLLGG